MVIAISRFLFDSLGFSGFNLFLCKWYLKLKRYE